MADEVRIHLSTYLKDAGIKATRQQIDKLAQDVKKINSDVKSGTDEAVGSLGKLPGAFGKIQGVVSGFGAKAMAVIAAFKVGWDVGTWLKDNVIFPLFKIKDPVEELKKRNEELKRQCEAAAKAWEERMAKLAAGWEAEAKSARNAVKHVEDLTRAYLQMQKAREQIASAGDDAEMLGLRRDKFNAMAGASTAEEASALGKEHDVRIAEAAARQKIEQYDRDAESRAKQLEAEEKKLRIATRHVNRVEKAIRDVEKRLADIEEYREDKNPKIRATFASMYAKGREQLAKLKEERRAAEAEEDRQRSTVEAARVAATANPQMRQNIIDAAQLEIDEKKKAYDDYVAQIEREDQERAEEMARQEEELREREARKAEEEMLRLVAAEQKERQKMEQELAAQRISDLRTELSERQRAEAEAQSRQATAAGSLQTAWGWYRNQSQMQAVIDERKAQAAAEVQWQKDFERLKTWRSDWRTAEFGSLSAAEEAVRQVAFAKEEKSAADRAVIETAENTRDLAEKLDELLQVKG